MKENSHSEELKCPTCGAVFMPGVRFCSSCGALLTRECPACGASNLLTARRCAECGQEMEILESLFDRVTGTRAGWLRQVQAEAPAIKDQQEAASQARLAEMWAVEARRREALAQAQAERDRQQRIIVTVTAAIAAFVVVVILIALAITLSRVSGPYFYSF